MNWILMIFVANLFAHDVIKANTDHVTSPSDNLQNLDTSGGLVSDFSTTRGRTVSDDVSCTTVDDVAASRVSLCPAQCKCSPLSGQDVLTKLTVDCLGGQFNESTTLRFNHELIQLLSLCDGRLSTELTELTVTRSPLSSVPNVVCQLSKLRSLHLDYNQLSALPSNCFTHMLNLTSFWANHNRLTSLQVRSDLTIGWYAMLNWTAVLRKRIKWPWKRISKYYENAWNKVYKNARKKSTKTHGQSLRKRIYLKIEDKQILC